MTSVRFLRARDARFGAGAGASVRAFTAAGRGLDPGFVTGRSFTGAATAAGSGVGGLVHSLNAAIGWLYAAFAVRPMVITNAIAMATTLTALRNVFPQLSSLAAVTALTLEASLVVSIEIIGLGNKG